ncbi:unnamed protein product [Adineta steineri]|uniref:Uncharacterized protein n=1 Tax=Adineta steineri TaxID=433720 RepID=A0A814DCJ9_9BILA|nr:unnamed protein product [Adineta steineri]CAF1191104.1 unnamed protein product [Adineta steineri]
MPVNKKQRIRGIRILLTVFYGFLLSSILSCYVIHGIIDTIQGPVNSFAIIMIVLGILILITIPFTVNAIWCDNTTIMMVSSIVLGCIFALTLIRIVKTPFHHAITATTVLSIVTNVNDSSNAVHKRTGNRVSSTSNTYTIIEDGTELIIQLVVILFAIIGIFILFRYVKVKYASVPITKSATSSRYQ